MLACSKPSSNTLIVGTISGPETELVNVAKEVAFKKYGIKIKIVEFNDYNLPNAAVEDGSLDANVYQHLPYLQSAINEHGYHLEAIGKTFVYPVGIYSKKINHLEDLPEKAIIALPNDPSNESRALLLLQQAKLIKLNNKPLVSVHDIIENPKQFSFKLLDAAQLPRILPDVEVAVINTTFAIPAGLSPSRDALYAEGKDSSYANLIVVRNNSEKKEQLGYFVKAMNSNEVKIKAKEIFGDAAIPAW